MLDRGIGVFVLVHGDLQHTGTSECLRRKRGARALDCAIAELVEVPWCSSARFFASSIGAGRLLLPAAGCWRAGGSHAGLWGWEGAHPLVAVSWPNPWLWHQPSSGVFYFLS